MTIRDFDFDPAVLEAPAGAVALIVHNADATRHDLTIDRTVSLDVPGKRTRRATFHLPTGDHIYWCTLHPSLTGELRVT